MNWFRKLIINGSEFLPKDSGAVRYDESMSLTDAQKLQARNNIGAGTGGGGGGEQEVYWATYGSSTSSDIESAYQSGMVCGCKYNDRIYTLFARANSESHTFVSVATNYVYTLICAGDSWYTSNKVIASPSNQTPSDLGNASAGDSDNYSRANHVHKMPSASDIGAYALPSGGIPASDLASAVQTSLGKADTAYQKPSGGIPASDMASGVIPSSASDVGAVASNQGTGNAGKFLVVGNDGVVTVVALSVWQGGSY